MSQWAECWCVCFLNQLSESQEEVAKELGIPVRSQRFWLWAKRQNQTYRPNRPLTEQEEHQTVLLNAKLLEILVFMLSSSSAVYSVLQVGALKEAANKAHNAELKLFLEVLPDQVRASKKLEFSKHLFPDCFCGMNV